MAVTKFQDKFASLRQVNSSNSQDKFQICCTDMYLVEFLANFAVFHLFFLSISRDFADIPEFRGSATARNFRSPDVFMNTTVKYCTCLCVSIYSFKFKEYFVSCFDRSSF